MSKQLDESMQRIWLATVACCTALHDIGFDAEEIAEEMPRAMSQLGKEVLARYAFPGDSIKLGQDYAETLAATRAGREA